MKSLPKDKLLSLPKDILLLTVLDLDTPSVISLCQSADYYNKTICKSKDFWYNRIAKNYPFLYTYINKNHDIETIQEYSKLIDTVYKKNWGYSYRVAEEKNYTDLLKGLMANQIWGIYTIHNNNPTFKIVDVRAYDKKYLGRQLPGYRCNFYSLNDLGNILSYISPGKYDINSINISEKDNLAKKLNLCRYIINELDEKHLIFDLTK